MGPTIHPERSKTGVPWLAYQRPPEFHDLGAIAQYLSILPKIAGPCHCRVPLDYNKAATL